MPRLDDDGQTVELDLHGCRLHEALDLIDATLDLAARRGRHAVRIVHGRSTSSSSQRTIKSEFLRLLDEGAYSGWITSTLRRPGNTHCSLRIDQMRPDSTPIKLYDVW